MESYYCLWYVERLRDIVIGGSVVLMDDNDVEVDCFEVYIVADSCIVDSCIAVVAVVVT